MEQHTYLRLYVVLGVLFLLSFLYFFLGSRVEIYLYDEGLLVYGATRILDGDIPYRDFRAIYAPGQFYLLASAFKIFGTSIMVGRILGIIIQSFLGLCVFLLSRKLVPHKFALISWILYLLGMYGFMGSPVPVTTMPAQLFALLSCLCLTNYLFTERDGRNGLFWAGILAGIATLFRHDLGFYTFISGLLAVFTFTYKIFDKPQKAIKKRIVSSLGALLRYSAGTGVILLPVCIFFISVCPIDVLISDLIEFPIKIYPKVRSLPFPLITPIHHLSGLQFNLLLYIYYSLYIMTFYIPIAILVATAIQLISRMRRGFRITDKEWLVMLCLLMGVTLFNYVRVRPDPEHLTPFFIITTVVFPWFFHGVARKDGPKISRKYNGSAWIVAFVLAVLLVSFPVIKKVHKTTALVAGKFVSLKLERAYDIYDGGIFILPIRDAIDYIKRYVPPGEKIFVGNARHDKIFFNDIMFYFLSNRHSATRYYHFDPGVQTTRAVQQKMIIEIKENTVNYIVLWGIPQPQEPNESSKSSGVYDLDIFIYRNYEAVEQFGPYLMLRRISNHEITRIKPR